MKTCSNDSMGGTPNLAVAPVANQTKMLPSCQEIIPYEILFRGKILIFIP
jgi:hypothetical protein